MSDYTAVQMKSKGTYYIYGSAKRGYKVYSKEGGLAGTFIGKAGTFDKAVALAKAHAGDEVYRIY